MQLLNQVSKYKPDRFRTYDKGKLDIVPLTVMTPRQPDIAPMLEIIYG